MSTIVYASPQNGQPIHYYANNSEPCHPSIVAGSWTVTDGNIDSTDLIQLDAVSVGVIVPLRRNGIAYDERPRS